ncbi:hypothetical protein HFO56_24180 [Rhizobium laguerreae]|uniref:hypothetical protein n=1 Tax=Rhizobium laguerreae TaxID=1076926 RepID=UPI001C91F150|nr:hypothetical protein [Rhizobium laguerreae]MBY3155428.1 hypothetical protein [Rhizobium laguerreae]
MDSVVPAIDSLLKDFQHRINNNTKDEIRKNWHPSGLALQALRYLRPAVRQLTELDAVRERIAEFDHEDADRQHETLGNQLAATCIACNGRVYTVEPKPFITVLLRHGKVEVAAEIGDAAKFLEKNDACVRLFPITEKEAALALADELASRTDRAMAILPFDFEPTRAEFLQVDADALQYRLLAETIRERFAQVGKRMGVMRVATEVPFEALDIIRSLVTALKTPRWDERLQELEAAANSAIDYDDAQGTAYFVDRRNPAQMAMLELWRDRQVHVEFSGLKSAP